MHNYNGKKRNSYFLPEIGSLYSEFRKGERKIQKTGNKSQLITMITSIIYYFNDVI